MSHEIKPFAPSVYAARVARAQEVLRAQGLDALLAATGPDFAYLTGSWMTSNERLTALVIPAEGTPRLVAPQTDVLELQSTAVPEMGMELIGWADGEDPYGLALGEAGYARLAVSASLTADHLFKLQEHAPDAELLLASTALSELFMRKDDAELEQLRGAAAAIDRVHEAVPELLRAGLTEREVAADIEERILAEHVSVDFIIVGSGPNGANPHHSFSDRVLAEGEPVVVDIGGMFGAGYHSDCTRTYVVGGPELANAPFRDAYAILAEAQAAARALAAPGVRAQDIDAAARSVIAEAGFGDAFFHRTGHGIGLSVHEEPFLLAGNELVLEEGMTFSIEPGIYLEGTWGMRLEDIVVTTADGCESLNACPRELR